MRKRFIGRDEGIPDVSPLSVDEAAVLARLMDIVIPADASVGGWSGGVGALLDEHLDGFMAWSLRPLREVVRLVDGRAKDLHGAHYLELQETTQEQIFAELESAERAQAAPNPTGLLDRQTLTPFAALALVAFEGYYGGTSEPAGWAVANYRPVPPGVEPIEPQPVPETSLSAIGGSYDVIVIGAGAGGGVVAAELAEAGRRVLLVERSRPHTNRELRGNHLQGKRLGEYDVTAGPGPGNPRVLEHPDGSTTLLHGEGRNFDWGLVAMTLGGGTRVWQGMSWRFYPEDFRMVETYGAPEGSTLADWPFDYEELAPYYDRIEWELGVSGDSDGVLAERTPRSRRYPMPALPDDRVRLQLSASAATLGWRTTSIPFAINSVPRDGRAACVRCSQCIGHACPVDAKNGTQNTFIPRAVATGNADLLMRSQVLEIEHDGRGRASGIRIVTETGDGPVESRVHADRIVVSAGALESPRLLLASGLGNEWVGRNHHSHGFVLATAREPSTVKTDVGPGHSVATLDFVHRGGEAWGGGVLFDMLPDYPLGRALSATAASGHRYGLGHKDWMRRSILTLGAMSMVQEVPDASARISIDPVVRDRHGMPVVRAAGTPHPATWESVEYMAARAKEWIEAAGGRDVSALAIPGATQGSEHSAGTVRLGTDPAQAACDERGRVFGTANVYVADASLHPTNGGFNPGLTAMANALRVATLLLAE